MVILRSKVSPATRGSDKKGIGRRTYTATGLNSKIFKSIQEQLRWQRFFAKEPNIAGHFALSSFPSVLKLLTLTSFSVSKVKNGHRNLK